MIVHLDESMVQLWQKYKNIRQNSHGWTIDSVIYQNISVLSYKTLTGIKYIKLLKEINHLRKRFNIRNTE